MNGIRVYYVSALDEVSVFVLWIVEWISTWCLRIEENRIVFTLMTFRCNITSTSAMQLRPFERVDPC